jgi:glycosyltransferase involved in cell wall biosynthesis
MSAKKADLTNLLEGLKTELPDAAIVIKSLPRLIFRLGLPGILEAWLCYLISLIYFLPTAASRDAHYWHLITDNAVAVPYLFLLRILHNRQQRVLTIHFFLHGSTQKRMKQMILRFLLNNERLLILVWNEQERDYFRSLGCAATIDYFPYCQPAPKCSGLLGKNEIYLFSGGSTNRDYDCIIAAAEKLNHKFVIICSRTNDVKTDLPNVRIIRDVSDDDFHSYLQNATIVIIALKAEIVSSGQMVALSSMAFGKPIIYSQIPAISQYFENGVNGIGFIKGDAKDLALKVHALMSDKEMQRQLGNNARRAFQELYGSERLMKFIADILLDRSMASLQKNGI